MSDVNAPNSGSNPPSKNQPDAVTGMLLAVAGGLGATLLQGLALSGGALFTGFFYLAPLPIMLVALCWSPLYGVIAALIGAASMTGYANPLAGGVFLVATGFPANALAWIALQIRPEARPEETQGSASTVPEFTTPGRLLHVIATMGSAMIIAGLGMLVGSYDVYQETASQEFANLMRENAAELPLPESWDPQQAATTIATLLPMVGAALWVVAMALNLLLAARVARGLGLLRRPWPVISDTVMPFFSLIILSVSLGLALMSGGVGFYAGIVASAFASAYFLTGLAAVHALTRQVRSRKALLLAIYLSLILFIWTAFFIFILGVADSLFGWRKRMANEPS